MTDTVSEARPGTPSSRQVRRELEAILALPVQVEDLGPVRRLRLGSPTWERHTTELSLVGAGHVGRGEDVTWIADHHDGLAGRLHAVRAQLREASTIGDLEELVPTLGLTSGEAAETGMTRYAWWGILSAALDLGLRQQQMSLADLLGRPIEPLTWVVSMSLGTPPDTGRVLAWARQVPGLGFKLDASDAWTDGVCAELAAGSAVRVIDLKAWYPFEEVRQDPDPALYERLARHFPEAIMEDPGGDDDVLSALGDGRSRVAYDQPLHEPADLDRMPLDSGAVNVKPSRMGTFSSLLGMVALAADRGIPVYSGGQSELGIGRTQAQAIAAAWCPHAPNDISPAIFHTATPGDEVPTPPLELPSETGFGWQEDLPGGVIELPAG